MFGTRLGIAGAVATCAFLGSLGAPQPALASTAEPLATETLFMSSATTPSVPVSPGHKCPRRRGAGPVFTVDESAAKRFGTDDLQNVLTLAGYASGTDDIAGVGPIAAVNAPARRWTAVETRAARGPPCC